MGQNVIAEYLEQIKKITEKIESTQMEKIKKTAELFAKTIAEDGLIHMYGSGHSRMGVEEMFPRYGSFPGFHPIVELSTANYAQVVGVNGIRQSMFIENVEGLAAQILKNFKFAKNDVFMVFSTTGVGNVTLETAMEAQKMGLPVVAITGVENSELAIAKHHTGKKLMDCADIVIDTCVPPGDAVIKIDNFRYPVGPVSTIANSLIVNLIKVETGRLLVEMGKPMCVITSSHFIGAEESKEIIEKTYQEYRRRVSRL